MSFSQETIANELLHAVNLNCKHRGELAELAFMRKAATLGFAIAKPWGDSDRYDVVVRVARVCWRVQVKSVLAKAHGTPYYRVKTSGSGHTRYSADEIDFLVVYIFPEDIWYVLPVALVEDHQGICVTPGSKRSLYEQYREAWGLMRPAASEPATAQAAAAVAST